MAKNSNLHTAKKEKNDEFYTQLTDVERELKFYKDFFKGKKVLCNCNDNTWSAFFIYFSMNFEHLGLEKLTCIGFNKDGHGVKHVFEGDKNGNRKVDAEEITTTELKGHGDFRDDECVEMLLEADVVVTNPPFSLFRDFIALMVRYEKKFLVIGNSNAVTYKEVFPLIKDNQMWLGVTLFTGKMPFFSVPKNFVSENDRTIVKEDGTILKQVNSIAWFTNIDNPKRHTPLDLYKKYSPEEYPHYDNYDAINVDKTADIPMDWDGVMGVPITFLDKYCPEQFEIVSFRKGEDGKDLVFTREREREFNRTFVSLFDSDSWDDKKCRRQSEWENYLCKNNDNAKKIKEPIDYFFPNSMILGGLMNNPKDTVCCGKSKYARILIRHR